ncbi:hypothetical protein SYNPS1DRAFT_29867 [Syncephalis pseudoplumigaleata]|uniref:Beta-trefoil DNA-binding domain-containing protein n=1 Tax=Syncephalis pseudoplumigaleata TaxID=1712513 RepID=A0A4P9YW98_9FUNG|nr:hypothetical protein SYNPS1DRAFT_29867 [Syncephalis pseudoplumigaleata]|eukprot:RKP24363.1 hypothetical protein SYNPS1DRAFT_29867 [Syncephalis pseudoplumigaleata]
MSTTSTRSQPFGFDRAPPTMPWPATKDNSSSSSSEARVKRARVSAPRESSPCIGGLSDSESHASSGSLRSLLDAVELEHQRLSSASPSATDNGACRGIDSDWSTMPSPVQPSHSHASMSIASLINRDDDGRLGPMLASINACSDGEESQHSCDETGALAQLPHGWTCSKPMREIDPSQSTAAAGSTMASMPNPPPLLPLLPLQPTSPSSLPSFHQHHLGASGPTMSGMDHHPPLPHSDSSIATMARTRDIIAHMQMIGREQANGSHAAASTTASAPLSGGGAATITTVTCWHAAVAQKSYGCEKRFLCPPPVVRVLRHSLPAEQDSMHASARDHSQSTAHDDSPSAMDKPQLSMTVMCENASRDLVQKSLLDENHMGSFKYLHVTGTDKAKQFYLKLKLHGRNSIPFATFDSAPIAIISKPSKKTVKARNISTCIFDGCHVSLFSRINSQTVRTRYLDTEDGRLCAKNSSWSAFTIEIVRDSTTPIALSYSGMAAAASAAAVRLGAIPITYGSRIVLTDRETGTSTGPLIIRKVERGQIVQDANGPVSQMQKVALEKADDPLPGTVHDPAQAVYLCAGYDANLVSTTELGEGYHKLEIKPSPFLSFNRPRQATDTLATCIDDHLCWTIVGLAQFQYTFCEQAGAAEEPVSPCPEIVGELTVNLESAQPRLYIPVRHWYAHIRHQLQPPRELWLGSLGPVPVHVVHPSHYSFCHRQETSADITLIEVILPDPSVLLMEKKKEGGGSHRHSDNAPELPPIHVGEPTVWRYLSAPLYLLQFALQIAKQ